MAQSELEFKLTWENNVSFTLTAKKDAEPVKTIVSLEENGQIGTLWEHVQAICTDYFRTELDDIGATMKG